MALGASRNSAPPLSLAKFGTIILRRGEIEFGLPVII